LAHFFDALSLRSEAVVTVAKKVLEQVLVNNTNLPRDLLKNSLRPLLLVLNDPKRLSAPLLEALARLLFLLKAFFNDLLGDKLITLLNLWCKPETSASKASKPSELTQIPVALIEAFHLLPPSSAKLLDALVKSTLQLEADSPRTHLPMTLESPFRPPLIKFLNQHTKFSVEFFLARVSEPAYRSLFRYILKSPDAGPSHFPLSSL